MLRRGPRSEPREAASGRRGFSIGPSRALLSAGLLLGFHVAPLAAAQTEVGHSAPSPAENERGIAQTTPATRYQLRVLGGGKRLQMVACFAGEGLSEVVPGEPFGRPFLRASSLNPIAHAQPWQPSARGIAFPKQEKSFCVAYDVDLDEALKHAGARVIERIGNSWSLDPDLFLYRPKNPWPKQTATIDMCVPQNWSVSVPWPALSTIDPKSAACDSPHEQSLRFALKQSVFYRRGRVFLGHFPQKRVRVSHADFDVAFLDGEAMKGRGIEQWLRSSALAVEHMYGVFPRKRVQVSVRAAPGRGAQFGMVFRAGGVGAHFWLGEDTRAEDLRHDWVGVHELSHLSLPFIGSSEPWLSEGVATYYQYLLQVRAGWISETEFWAHLIDGIDSATGTSRDSLRNAAARMDRTGGYRRVYWGGAALVWLADVTLRARSGGLASLDFALERLWDCCLPSEQRWTATTLSQKLDFLTQNTAFHDVFTTYLDRSGPIPLEELLRNLGISYGLGRVRLRDDAPWAHIRRAMVAPVRKMNAGERR